MQYFQHAEKDNTGIDSKLMVRFWVEAHQDEAKSAAEGRPVFEDVDYIEIASPGDRSNIVQRPIEQDDIARFRRLYESWKAGQSTDGVVGTLLREVPWVSRSQVEELAYFKVRTVENLAALPDSALGSFGPGVGALRERAKAYLRDAKAQAPMAELNKRLEERDAQIAALREQVAELAAAKKGK